VELIEIGKNKALGLKVEIPKAPILLLLYKNMIVGCGYFSIEAMEKFGNAACVVRGVIDFREMLNAEIQEMTSEAQKLGARKGMKVRELLERLDL